MQSTNEHNQRIANMSFASVYPLYLSKIEKKGRSKEELHGASLGESYFGAE